MNDANAAQIEKRIEKLAARIAKVEVLVHLGATEGERAAAAARFREMAREFHRLIRR